MTDPNDDADVLRLRAAFGPIFDAAVAIFSRHDPLGLDAVADPHAYLPEIETVLERLPEAAAADDVRQIVHDELQRRVDEMAGPEMIYEAIAEDLFEAWTRIGPRD